MDSEDTESEETIEWDSCFGKRNYCRNPDSNMEEAPWCYTMEPNVQHKTELFEIPKCPPHPCDFHEEVEDSKREGEAMDCQCAEQFHGAARRPRVSECWPLSLREGPPSVAREGTRLAAPFVLSDVSSCELIVSRYEGDP